MIKKIPVLGLAIVLFAGVQAQAPKDRKIIDQLCGCFEVSFKYAETFAPSADYKFHEREEIGGTAELALPIEVSDKKVVIQHLLIVGPKTVVKHWREEWTYENPVIWKYTGDRTWVKETLPADQVKGKWTQTVWEVADEPRYQGLSQFVEMDGRIIWQSTTDAPLPRREYTVRNDYNILQRTNRLNIVDGGYLHEQDNRKIIRSNGTDQLLVEEKGHNNYKKIEEKECEAARQYWEENKEYWSKVRRVWEEYVNTHDVITLREKIDNKLLHEYLLTLSRDYAAKKVSAADIDARIRAEISRFIVPSGKKLAGKK